MRLHWEVRDLTGAVLMRSAIERPAREAAMEVPGRSLWFTERPQAARPSKTGRLMASAPEAGVKP